MNAPTDKPTSERNLSQRKPVRHGFSLIELIVVLVLMAIMASLASLSIQGVIVRQRLARAVEVVEQFDLALRRAAGSQSQSVEGRINRRDGVLTVQQNGQRKGDRTNTYRLPPQVSIDAVRYASGREISTQAKLVAHADGTSPTYALRFSTGSAHTWVLIVGGSGQVVHGLDNGSVESLLNVR